MATKTQGGFEYWTVAGSGYEAYRLALDGLRVGSNMSLPEYGNLGQDEQDAYEVMCRFIEEQLESWDGGSWSEAAGKAYEFWRINAAYSTEWKNLPEKEKAAWEAMLRHIVNVLQMEVGEDLSEHEERWAGYAEKQAPKYKEYQW